MESHGEATTKKYDGQLNVEKHREKTAADEPEQHDESIRTTNDGEFNAENHDDGMRMKNDGEFNAENDDDGINMKNAGPFNFAERHQKLTAGSKASSAPDAKQLTKEVIRASTWWFASDGCYEDEVRDGIG
jgi:hypothetical protein